MTKKITVMLLSVVAVVSIIAGSLFYIDNNKKIQNGSLVKLNYTGYLDNKEYPGSKIKNYSVKIGSKQLMGDFEQKLIGHKKGDVVNVEVYYPKDYPVKQFKDKKAVFKTKIVEVKDPESK